MSIFGWHFVFKDRLRIFKKEDMFYRLYQLILVSKFPFIKIKSYLALEL